jgi:hypothetical protein
MITSFESFGAKKECAELLEKFQNIQSQLKQGQSIKSSASLRKQEDEARDKWWNCENNKSTSSSKNENIKTAKKKAIVKSTTSDNATLQYAPQVFSSNKDIVIKGRFSGEKQFQWLEYYQRPKKCARPKTTQVFAFCMEDKTEQQNKFEEEYQNNK